MYFLFFHYLRTKCHTLRARPREVSSRVLGLLRTYCTVHTQLFFMIWIRSNIFPDTLGCNVDIQFFIYFIIRFVSFPTRISNCSTSKTREDTAKRKQKVKNDCSAFLQYLDLVKHIS